MFLKPQTVLIGTDLRTLMVTLLTWGWWFRILSTPMGLVWEKSRMGCAVLWFFQTEQYLNGSIVYGTIWTLYQWYKNRNESRRSRSTKKGCETSKVFTQQYISVYRTWRDDDDHDELCLLPLRILFLSRSVHPPARGFAPRAFTLNPHALHFGGLCTLAWTSKGPRTNIVNITTVAFIHTGRRFIWPSQVRNHESGWKWDLSTNQSMPLETFDWASCPFQLYVCAD